MTTDSEVSDVDDDDAYDESLLDRVYALKDIVPPTYRKNLSSVASTSYSWLSSGLSFSGKSLWVLSTSALLLGVPWALAFSEEQQVQEMEREMRMQQSAGEVSWQNGENNLPIWPWELRMNANYPFCSSLPPVRAKRSLPCRCAGNLNRTVFHSRYELSHSACKLSLLLAKLCINTRLVPISDSFSRTNHRRYSSVSDQNATKLLTKNRISQCWNLVPRILHV